MSRAIYAKGSIYKHPSNKKRLDKQVKDLAWLIVKHKFGDPVLTAKAKGHITKRKTVVKYVEIRGSMTLSEKDTATFVLTNNWGFDYKMTVFVNRNGKSLFTAQGNVEHCFSVLRTLGTK